MKRIALLGLLIALAAGLVLLWRALATKPEGPASAAATGSTGRAEKEPSGHAAPLDSDIFARDRAAAAEVESNPTVKPEAGRPDPAKIEIHGEVIVLDPSGGTHPSEDGSFMLGIDQGGI